MHPAHQRHLCVEHILSFVLAPKKMQASGFRHKLGANLFKSDNEIDADTEVREVGQEPRPLHPIAPALPRACPSCRRCLAWQVSLNFFLVRLFGVMLQIVAKCAEEQSGNNYMQDKASRKVRDKLADFWRKLIMNGPRDQICNFSANSFCMWLFAFST